MNAGGCNMFGPNLTASANFTQLRSILDRMLSTSFIFAPKWHFWLLSFVSSFTRNRSGVAVDTKRDPGEHSGLVPWFYLIV